MSIERLSSANPYNQSISDIDKNTFELNGLIDESNFCKNEIDAIYEDIGLSRKFKILSGAGNSLTTYSNWSHVTAESGYSIWKIPFTNFKDNIVNEAYLDDTSMTYKGKADQESYTAFDTVFLYDGASYIDDTVEASTEEGSAFALMSATTNYIYLGASGAFSAVDFDFNIKGANYTLKIEYYNGAWAQITTTAGGLVDNTNNFKSNGRIEYTLPSDSIIVAVNGVSKHWVRISTTTTPITTATAFSIFPGNSVYSLLQLSSTNVLNQEWAWCYFNDKIYVTIRNSGNSQYEGNTFITSSSSVTNKQNFFIYNHVYKFSYEQTSYTTGAMFTPTYGARWYNTGSSINIINWSNTTPFKITNTRSTALALRLDAGTIDTTTGASTGSDGNIPAQVAKYLAIDIDGTTYKIPLYNT
jgi:hypothetical protein